MARDIEEFLRRAAERRKQQKAGGGQAQPPQQPPRQPRPQSRRPIQPPLEEVEVEIIEPEIVQPRRSSVKPRKPKPLKSSVRPQSVSQHVDAYMDTSDIAEHAEALGDRIASVHDRVDRQIHQRLDHDINRIDDMPTVTDDPRVGVTKDVSPVAESLIKMLADPESMRQAILISEILNPPDWD